MGKFGNWFNTLMTFEAFLNHSYGCSNAYTVNKLPKSKLGFQGFVMRDWWVERSRVEIASASQYDHRWRYRSCDWHFILGDRLGSIRRSSSRSSYSQSSFSWSLVQVREPADAFEKSYSISRRTSEVYSFKDLLQASRKDDKRRREK